MCTSRMLPAALSAILAFCLMASEDICAADEGVWWSLRAPVRPSVPVVKQGDWIRTPVDAFVLAKLEAKDLQPAPPADRAVLLRRVTYDLLGLPPTPEEIAAFVRDADPLA